MRQIKEVLDKTVEKIISKKFLAWIVATFFCYNNTITGDQWMSITLGYIGVQGFIDMAMQWKRSLPTSKE